MAIDSLCTNARIYFFMIHKIQRLLRHDVSLWWKYLIWGKSRYGAEHQKTAWSLQRSEMSSSLEISNIWLRLFTLLHTSEPRVLGIFILILVCALGTRSVQSFVKHIVLQRIMLSEDEGLSIQMIDKVPERPFLLWDGLPPQSLMEIGQVATVAEEVAEVGGQVERAGARPLLTQMAAKSARTTSSFSNLCSLG